MSNITIATTTTTIDAAAAIVGIGTGAITPDMPVILEHGAMPVGQYVNAIMQREQALRALIVAHSKAIGQIAGMHIPTTEHSMLIDALCQARHELHEHLDAITRI